MKVITMPETETTSALHRRILELDAVRRALQQRPSTTATASLIHEVSSYEEALKSKLAQRGIRHAIRKAIPKSGEGDSQPPRMDALSQ